MTTMTTKSHPVQQQSPNIDDAHNWLKMLHMTLTPTLTLTSDHSNNTTRMHFKDLDALICLGGVCSNSDDVDDSKSIAIDTIFTVLHI